MELEDFDLLLFSGEYWWPSKLFEWLQWSSYSHVGLVLNSPTYIDPKLTGTYLLEAGEEDFPDSENGVKKFGVQITDLDRVLTNYEGSVWVRKLKCCKDTFHEKFKNIHSVIHNKPYDDKLLDLFRAGTGIEFGDCRCDKQFFCSALVTYVYSRLGVIQPNVEWSLVEPKEYADGGRIESLLLTAILEKTRKIK